MRLRTVLLTLVVLGLLVVGYYVVVTRYPEKLPPQLGLACRVNTSSGTVALDTTQMANAATITAVGIRRDLPDRAMVIALATAYQESKLENLEGGDRDSVGLFQQRPSQGWGTAEQINDPRYSAGRFYSALVRVNGWESMRITEAAQRVQRSAYPEAYEKWADEATVLVEALAGRATSAVSCAQVGTPAMRGEEALQSLHTSMRLDWGEQVPSVPSSSTSELVLAPNGHRTGWQYSHWIVAQSAQSGVARVRFDNKEWSADAGTWQAANSEQAELVVAEVYPS